MSALAAAGWAVAGAAASRWALPDRRASAAHARLEAAGDAEHELRGALTAFGLALDRLGRDPLGRRIGRALASELDRARAALDELAAAREGASHPPLREPLALDRLARSAAAAWQPAARAAGRRVLVDWRAGPVCVRADRGRLARALGNLLSNAVEHGSGPVRVEATRRGRRVRLEVVNGLRGEDPAGSAPGRGRGLRIAARAVEDCGGTLSFSRGGGRAAAALELPLGS
ncbi:MAG: two-component system, OmpR family, sensor kinase [Thermoleophilaceae bacterium]|nr:two-component system, OmpR family, sensor kinase [Thermoleophilaceae bacterium]